MAEGNESTPLPFGAADPTQLAQQALMQLNSQFNAQTMLLSVEHVKDKKITRHKFTPEEDEILRNLVQQYGKSDWVTIAQHFQNRSARQCRDRWKHYLSPDVIVGGWTDEDDQLLIMKVQELGPRWSTITNFFPGRTDIGVKNHYISITNGRKNKETKDRNQRAILLPLAPTTADMKIEDTMPVPDPVVTAGLPLDLPPPNPATDDSVLGHAIIHTMPEPVSDTQQ